MIAVGMTVAPRIDNGKKHEYTRTAITSLRSAGYSGPLHIFAEPGADAFLPNVKQNNLQVVHNAEKLGCFRNFKAGLTYLVNNTTADWFLMLQDDTVWKPGSFAVLQQAMIATDPAAAGVFSPYTSKAMAPNKKGSKEQQGWVSAKFNNRSFWGALALCFSRQSAEAMLNAPRFINHTHHRKLDVVVGNVIRRDLELPVLVHVPSLCDHIGAWSTLGRHRFKALQWGRRGYKFDPAPKASKKK